MKVTKETLIGDILEYDVNTAKFFFEIGMHCLGCPASRGENIEDACAVHGTNADELVAKMKGDKVLTLEPHLAVFDAYASIDNSEMKHKFHFTSNNEAFDCAVKAIKEILVKAGYKEVTGGFEKV